jgi:hypothetical protein
MIPHFSLLKLGKGPALIDPRTLKIGNYFTSVLPSPPSDVDNTFGQTEWGMMLNGPNDGSVAPAAGLGNCTIAGGGHAEQVWSLAARGGMNTPPDKIILSKYELWCGYVLNDPTTDNGGVEISVLNSWRNSKFWEQSLKMYADPEPTNLEHVKQCIHLFGGVYIGVQLPVSVQGSNVWDVSSGPNSIPGSWGGHAVYVCKYRTNSDGTITFTCISWGGVIEITQAFWKYNDSNNGPYIDEVHALVSPEFLSLKTGKTPEGLNLIQMEADMHAVTK